MRCLKILISIIFIASCTAEADVNLMAAPTITKGSVGKFSNSVCTRNVTGAEASFVEMSPIDNASFRAAIEKTLENNGLKAADNASCRYVVDANLLGIAVPTVAGKRLPATANVNYSVFSRRSGDAIYLATLVNKHEVEAGKVDMFTLNEQLYEGVIRKSLTQFATEFIREGG